MAGGHLSKGSCDFLTATPGDPRLEIEQGREASGAGRACGMDQPLAVAVTCPWRTRCDGGVAESSWR